MKYQISQFCGFCWYHSRVDALTPAIDLALFSFKLFQICVILFEVNSGCPVTGWQSSICFPNEPRISWTFLEHFRHHFWVCATSKPSKVMTKMFTKCLTDQRFIRKRNTTYKIHTLKKIFWISGKRVWFSDAKFCGIISSNCSYLYCFMPNRFDLILHAQRIQRSKECTCWRIYSCTLHD